MDVNCDGQLASTSLSNKTEKAMKFHNISLNLMFVFTLSAINFVCWFNFRCIAAATLRNETDMRALLEFKSHITEDYLAILE